MKFFLNLSLFVIFCNSLAYSPKFHINQIDSLINAGDSLAKKHTHWLRTVNITQQIIDSSNLNQRFEIYTFIFINKKVKVSMIDNFGSHDTLEFSNYQLAQFIKSADNIACHWFNMKYSVESPCFFKMEVVGFVWEKSISVNLATYIPGSDNFSEFPSTKLFFNILRTFQNSFQSLRGINPYSTYANVNVMVEKNDSSIREAMVKKYKIPEENFWYLQFEKKK